MSPLITIALAGCFLSPTASLTMKAPPARVRTVLPAIRVEKQNLLIPGKAVRFRASLIGTGNTPLGGRKLSFRLTWRAKDANGKFADLWDGIAEAETDEKGIAAGSVEVPADLLSRGTNGFAKLRIGFGGDLEATDNILYRERMVMFSVQVARAPGGATTGTGGTTGTDAPASASGTATPEPGTAAPEPGTSGGGQDAADPANTTDTPPEADGGGSGGSTSTTASVYPSSENEPPLGVESSLLRSFLGDMAGYEDASVAPEDAKIPRSAVSIVQDNFHSTPARFWLDGSIVKIKVDKAKPPHGIRIPGLSAFYSAEGVIRLHLTDTLTNAEWTWTESTKKQGADLGGIFPTLKVPGKLAELLNPKAALSRGFLKGYTADAPEEVPDLDLNSLFPDKGGEMLRNVMSKGAGSVRSRLAGLDWMVDVLSVRGKNVIINSGKGFPYKVGDQLGVAAFQDLVKDNRGNTKTILFAPVGKIEIVRVNDSFVTARIIAGEGITAEHFVCSTQTHDRLVAENVE